MKKESLILKLFCEIVKNWFYCIHMVYKFFCVMFMVSSPESEIESGKSKPELFVFILGIETLHRILFKLIYKELL
jgi:hypothetical protein